MAHLVGLEPTYSNYVVNDRLEGGNDTDAQDIHRCSLYSHYKNNGTTLDISFFRKQVIPEATVKDCCNSSNDKQAGGDFYSMIL